MIAQSCMLKYQHNEVKKYYVCVMPTYEFGSVRADSRSPLYLFFFSSSKQNVVFIIIRLKTNKREMYC